MTDVLVTGIVKGDEKYVILYSPSNAAEAVRTCGRWALNPDLSFSWYDAASVSKQIRRENDRTRMP